jgi:hypothetical protein
MSINGVSHLCSLWPLRPYQDEDQSSGIFTNNMVLEQIATHLREGVRRVKKLPYLLLAGYSSPRLSPKKTSLNTPNIEAL